jgi:hypothetical protein
MREHTIQILHQNIWVWHGCASVHLEPMHAYLRSRPCVEYVMGPIKFRKCVREHISKYISGTQVNVNTHVQVAGHV